MTKKPTSTSTDSSKPSPAVRFPKKLIETFKKYFMTPTGRKLLVLYPVFAEQDFYITSNVTPHYLMSGESEGAYGFIDLSGEAPELREQFRAMIRCLIPEKVCAVRMDYLTRLIELYNKDDTLPKSVEGVNKDNEAVHLFMSKKDIRITAEKMRELAADPEIKDVRKRDILKLAWDIDEGFFLSPLQILRDIYKGFQSDEAVDVIPYGLEDSVSDTVILQVGEQKYKVKPTIGVDTLDLKKFADVRVDKFVAKKLSNRAMTMAHYAMVGKPGEMVELMIYRPDAILFPMREPPPTVPPVPEVPKAPESTESKPE